MSRILITGASGFVGGHLVERLVRTGHDVRCLVRATSNTQWLANLPVELRLGDLTEATDWRALLSGVDSVFHVAALTRAVRAAELMRVNARGTDRLLRACAASSCPPRFVLVSSLAAKGTSPTCRPDRARFRPRPVSNYGRSKWAAELAARRWARSVPVTIVRPGIVFGPRDRDTVPLFRSVKRLGVHFIPGFRWSRVGVIDVRDLAELMWLAATRGATLDATADETNLVGCYDAVDPLNPTQAQLGRIIGRAVGRPHVLMIHCPVPFVMAAAGLGEIVARVRSRQKPFNWDKMRDATAGPWPGEVTPARQSLGFQPAMTFAERIEQTVSWYEEARWI